MIKKFVAVLISSLILLFSGFTAVLAQNNEAKIQLDFFYSNTCPHCAAEKVFLNSLKERYPQVQINEWGVWKKKDSDLLENFYDKYNVPQQDRGFVPATFINERYFLGYETDQNSGKEIENYIKGILNQEDPNTGDAVNGRTIKIPLIGEIDVSGFSPLVLAVILGTLDGFNACAMVALGFLLTVLVSSGKRERVFLVGSVFILVSGIVYFLFISTWLNLFLFLTNIKLITFFVGLVVVFFAVFLLKDYSAGVVCKICEVKPGVKESFLTKTQKKLFLYMQKVLATEMSLPLTLLGVSIVAAGINTVELFCSFGFPMIFTKILALENLSIFSYYFYILIYVIFYMLDDFIIFMIAVLTLRMVQESEKYLKIIKLVSGILLLLLGLIILIKPEILMFK